MEIHDWVLMTVIMVVVVVLIIYVAKIILLQKQLQHEETIKKLDFMQKKEWEQFVFERQDELAEKKKTEEQEEQKKQKEQSNGETNVSQEGSITAKQTDINRNVLLHLILSKKEENLTADKLEKELENIKKSYKIIEQYIND